MPVAVICAPDAGHLSKCVNIHGARDAFGSVQMVTGSAPIALIPVTDGACFSWLDTQRLHHRHRRQEMWVNPCLSLLRCERWTSCERPTAMADVTLLQSQLMVCRPVHVALIVVRARACACKLHRDPFPTGSFSLTAVVQTESVLQYLSRSHVVSTQELLANASTAKELLIHSNHNY